MKSTNLIIKETYFENILQHGCAISHGYITKRVSKQNYIVTMRKCLKVVRLANSSLVFVKYMNQFTLESTDDTLKCE